MVLVFYHENPNITWEIIQNNPRIKIGIGDWYI